MSWSDDNRCLFCDGKLPLYRKLAQGQFCSKAHQEAYWKEQEQLALESLHRTHDALQAYRPSVSIESILGPAPAAPPVAAPKFVDVDPPLAGLLGQASGLGAVRAAVAEWQSSEPSELEFLAPAVVPEWVAEPITIEPEPVPELDLSEVETGLLALAGFAAVDAQTRLSASAEPEYAAGLAQVPSLETTLGVSLPLGSPVAWNPLVARSLETLAPSNPPEQFPEPGVGVPLHAVSPCDETLDRIESEVFRPSETQFALNGPRPVLRVIRMVQSEAEPESFVAADLAQPACPRPCGASLEPVPPTALFPIQGPDPVRPLLGAVSGELSVLDAAPGAIEFGSVHLPLATSDPGMASLVRLEAPAVRASIPAALEIATDLLDLRSAPRLPEQAVTSSVPGNIEIRHRSERIFRLNALDRMLPQAGSYRARGAVVPVPVERDPQLPRLALEVFDPHSPFRGAGRGLHTPQLMAAIRGFWTQAPRDLKILLFAVPLAVGLAFHPSLPKVSVQAPQAGQENVGGYFQNALSTQVASVKKAIADRAAIGLDENFRQGLDNWMGNSGSTAEWSFDQAGFVQPGRVALYQPSLGLTDYELQFLGAIDKGALSWVVRATDFDNYYVVKLMVTKGGVIPQLGITRYAVIDGKAVDRVDTPVALNTRVDSLYRISMEMHGDHYALSIQGQSIDSWTEPRLKRGGVGFFTNRGEQSRIGWVQITHQYDMLGRLFAYLAP